MPRTGYCAQLVLSRRHSPSGVRRSEGHIMSDKLEPKIVLTDAPDPADTAVVQEGLRAYNTSQAGYDDYRPLAVFVTDPVSGRGLGGLYGGSYLGQLRVDRFFLPEDLRRDRLRSRLLAMAEEEGRRRGLWRQPSRPASGGSVFPSRRSAPRSARQPAFSHGRGGGPAAGLHPHRAEHD